MKYGPLKDRITFDKFLQAENIRTAHLKDHSSLKDYGQMKRKNINDATHRVFKLEKQMQVYWKYAQSKDIIKQRTKEFEKLEDTELLIRKVQRTLSHQDHVLGKTQKAYRAAPLPYLQRKKELMLKSLEDARPSKLFTYSKNLKSPEIMKKIYIQNRMAKNSY